ncbi:MAG: cobalamin-dependent protein [Candidatus Thorarchaeota archaeon]|jgi:5-methyltetrahydrofolate--homocysteine methyltransferase
MMSITEMVASGNVYDILDAVKVALKDQSPQNVLEELVKGLRLVGERFQRGEAFVTEMVCSAETFEKAMTLIEPMLAEGTRHYLGKIVLGTVRGDIHSIGKNLVATMMKGAGIEVIDLGIDIAPEAFVDAIKEHRPQFVGMSALVTSTMREMETTIKAIDAAGLRDDVNIMIGGVPVSQRFADSIGADIYGLNAGDAVEKALALLKLQNG